jgi:hypothetical protein
LNHRGKGFVKIWRRLREHPIWKGYAFTEGQAWVDLIMRAAIGSCEERFNDRFIPLVRGQLVASERGLAKDWGWSRNRVHSYLRKLAKKGHEKGRAPDEGQPMIQLEKGPGFIVVSLCQYKPYQDKHADQGRGRADLPDPQGDQKGPGKEPDMGRGRAGHGPGPGRGRAGRPPTYRCVLKKGEKSKKGEKTTPPAPAEASPSPNPPDAGAGPRDPHLVDAQSVGLVVEILHGQHVHGTSRQFESLPAAWITSAGIDETIRRLKSFDIGGQDILWINDELFPPPKKAQRVDVAAPSAASSTGTPEVPHGPLIDLFTHIDQLTPAQAKAQLSSEFFAKSNDPVVRAALERRASGDQP